MPRFNIKGEFLAQHCIDKCIVELPKLHAGDQRLVIVAEDAVIDINIAVIAFFVLINDRYRDLFPDFKIVLYLTKNIKPYNEPSGDLTKEQQIGALHARYEQENGPYNVPDEFAYTLRQYIAYAQLNVADKEFLSVFYRYALNNAQGEFDRYPQRSGVSKWFNLSETFMPILQITPDSYDVFFTAPLSINESVKQKIKYHNNNKQLFKNTKEVFAEAIYGSDSIIKANELLANLAFYQCLEKLNLLNFHLDKEGASPRASNLGKKQSPVLYEAFEDMIRDMAGRPPIYLFLYTILLSSKLIPGNVDSKNVADFTAAAKSLWRFSKELSYGLHELAKNIIRHSERKFGVLTGRIYSDERFDQFNPNFKELFPEYEKSLKEIPVDPVSYFEVYIADDGSKGIMDTLLELTEKHVSKGESERQLYQADAKLLHSRKIGLSHMLNSNRGLSLNQQAKRATAHLGLLTLTKLVQGNHGLLRVSTPDNRYNKPERTAIEIFAGQQSNDAPMPARGTNFHLILPVSSDLYYKPYFNRDADGVPDIKPSYITGMEKLLLFDLRNKEQKLFNNKYPHLHQLALNDEGCDQNTEYWDHLSAELNPIGKGIKNQTAIVCLDVERKPVDTSKLLRLLGNWEMQWPGQPLVVANIDADAYFEILRINYQYTDSVELPFWNERSAILFYPYVPIPARGRSKAGFFYFTDLLWGKTTADFYAVNKAIRQSNFNAITIATEETGEQIASALFGGEDFSSGKVAAISELAVLQPFGLFSDMGDLAPLDLFIKAEHCYTIFEKNAAVVLSNEIRTQREQQLLVQDNLISFLRNLPGYKVTDSHFRIGSKIHIADFYYAKRFFQDDFFVSPLAFLVTRTILRTHLAAYLPDSTLTLEEKKAFFAKGLTLVGYGQYAEVLMNLVESFLTIAIIKLLYGEKEDYHKHLSKVKINHDIVSDADQAVFIKNEESHPKIVVVIPIASTFSTSVKIEEAIFRHTLAEENILPPFVNVVYVYNSETSPVASGSIERKFGITSQDFPERTITVESFFSASQGEKMHEVEQRFLIPLPSEWHSVEECKICFENPETEKPLFITDKSYVTPVLIFDEPEKSPDEKDYSSEFQMDHSFVHYGHAVHRSRHYLFYVKVEAFFRENKDLITKWLKKLRDDQTFNPIRGNYGKTLIIAPANLSNTGFVSLVYEIFFQKSAKVIYYDPGSDHVQNFKLFHRREIEDEGYNMIFIDDVLNTGATFVKVNDFLKFSRKGNRGFDAAFFMIDRSDHYTHDSVVRKLTVVTPHCLCFANVKLPALTESEHDCQLCNEQERYAELVASSFLDRIQNYFLQKEQKLSPVFFPRFHAEAFKKKKMTIAHRHQSTIFLSRIWIMHLVYQWFSARKSAKPLSAFQDFEAWKTELFNQPETKFRFNQINAKSTAELLVSAKSDQLLATELANTVLKVLTQSPFTFYKPIKEQVFQWVLTLLSTQTRIITAQIDSEAGMDELSFRTLKFLMRRMGLLNSNFLISDTCFNLLRKLYEPVGLRKLQSKLENDKPGLEREIEELEKAKPTTDSARLLQQKNDELWLKQSTLEDLKTFNDFYASQVKELLFLNEARSIRLEKILIDQMELGGSHYFQQLLRILREENGILLLKYWDFVKDKVLFSASYSVLPLEQQFRNRGLVNHYRTKTIKAFFNQEDKSIEPESEASFLHYLWLMNFFRKDSATKQLLKDKTELIVSKLKDIIFQEQEIAGAFLIVKYHRREGEAYFTAYNAGKEGRMIEASAYDTKYPFLIDFLHGRIQNESQVNITVTELTLTENGWKDVYSLGGSTMRDTLSPDLLPKEYDHLLLVRVNRHELSRDENAMHPGIVDFPQAVLGFYVKKSASEVLLTSKIRYLLLLRQPLSLFIKNHHETNEFLDWVEAIDSIRTSLLTGHGREMLMSIADIPYKKSNIKPYKDIISTILIAQRFTIDLREETTFGVSNGFVKNVFREYFKPDLAPITQSYFGTWVKYIAKDIFRLSQIENPEDVHVKIDCKVRDFPFSQNLLNMILFELFVNAKKNRWTFRQDDPVPGYKKNVIEISCGYDKKSNKYLITIQNTGPFVDGAFTSLLNAPGSLKDADDPSGTYLIKTLLKEFGLGKINFSSQPIYRDFGWFIVNLELNDWYEKEDTAG